MSRRSSKRPSTPLAVDLRGDDEQAGLAVYTDRVIEAIGRRRRLSNRRGLVDRLLGYLGE